MSELHLEEQMKFGLGKKGASGGKNHKHEDVHGCVECEGSCRQLIFP